MRINKHINRILSAVFCACLACFCMGRLSCEEKAAPKEVKKEPAKIRHYEFDELVIKIRIQEPDVLFILDKPSILVEPFEEEMGFLEKIDDPIVKDNLF